MLNFQPITPSDTEALNRILMTLPDPGCEYSSANLYVWGPQQIAVEDDVVYIRSHHSGTWGYLYPACIGDETAAVRRLARDAARRKNPLTMYAVTDRARAQLEQTFGEAFGFYEVRRGADYVYDINRLADLKGKKLQAKRNHIHRFEDACADAQAVHITREMLPDCQEMIEKWYKQHEQMHPGSDFSGERRAIARTMDNYEALGFDGLALIDGADIVALTMGTRIRTQVFDVNFEKAFSDIPGAYTAINRAFARYLRETYPELTLLNREDDMGIEGLRKAKLSYYPDVLLRKWVAVAQPEQLL